LSSRMEASMRSLGLRSPRSLRRGTQSQDLLRQRCGSMPGARPSEPLHGAGTTGTFTTTSTPPDVLCPSGTILVDQGAIVHTLMCDDDSGSLNIGYSGPSSTTLYRLGTS